MNRRLAAILFYDAVGFSRAIGAAETATIATLKHHSATIITPLTRRHDGRLIKAMGDGGLIEFSSAVDAVHFAVAMQQAVAQTSAQSNAQANLKHSEQQILSYRIGINIGDVVVDGDDLLGDGVNVAARLEALAEPGGICLHQSVRDQVRNKLDLDFQDLGKTELKNIDTPVQVYGVVMNHKAQKLATSPQPKAKNPPSRLAFQRLGLALAAALILAFGLTLWQPWVTKQPAASVARMAFPLPDKPSLAVLPFDDMSEDQAQEHFADGMTEDLITDLSKISGLFIVARNSTFVYKGQSVNIAQVAEDLGVRYVLEGSVRRAGNQIRVNAQLIDATTGGHIWADRFDGEVTDMFALQDMFIRKIAKALAVNLTEEEKQEIALGQTSDFAAREKFQDGWDSYLRYSAQDNARAVERFKEALKIDPEYGRAHAALSLAYLRGCQQRWHEPLGLSVGEANAKALSTLKDAKARPSSLGNVAASRVNLYNSRYTVAQTEASRAIAKDPNDPEGYVALAWAMITTNEPDAGLELMDRAIRQNPTYPNYYILALAMAHYTLDDLDKSADILASALERDPTARGLAAIAASIYAQLGRADEAHTAIRIWMPEATPEELRAAPYIYHFPYDWLHRPEIVKDLTNGLHMAAMLSNDPIGDLVQELDSNSRAERISALIMLGRFGPHAAEAVPALIIALDDEKKIIRREAAVTLGQIGPAASAAIPALSTLVDQPIVGMRAKKAIALITK